MVQFFREGGFAMFVLAAMGIAILITSAAFAWKATPHRLSVIRALTIAIAFGAIIGMASGFAATAKYIVNHEQALADPLAPALQGFAESLTNIVFGGGLISISWILVAFGVRRMPKDPS